MIICQILLISWGWTNERQCFTFIMFILLICVTITLLICQLLVWFMLCEKLLLLREIYRT